MSVCRKLLSRRRASVTGKSGKKFYDTHHGRMFYLCDIFVSMLMALLSIKFAQVSLDGLQSPDRIVDQKQESFTEIMVEKNVTQMGQADAAG